MSDLVKCFTATKRLRNCSTTYMALRFVWPNSTSKKVDEHSFVSTQHGVVYMQTYVRFTVAGDMNLQQKRCCATPNIFYSLYWHVVQQHIQNTFYLSIARMVKRTCHNVTLYIRCVSYFVYVDFKTSLSN